MMKQLYCLVAKFPHLSFLPMLEKQLLCQSLECARLERTSQLLMMTKLSPGMLSTQRMWLMLGVLLMLGLMLLVTLQ